MPPPPRSPHSHDSDSDEFAVAKGDTVFIESETDNYYKIETSEGLDGYLMKSQVTISDVDLSKVDFYAPKKVKYVRGTEKINLVWQYVASTTPAAPSEREDGIDILAPTWFDQIVNGGGAVENHGDLGYSQSAAGKRLQGLGHDHK